MPPLESDVAMDESETVGSGPLPEEGLPALDAGALPVAGPVAMDQSGKVGSGPLPEEGLPALDAGAPPAAGPVAVDQSGKDGPGPHPEEGSPALDSGALVCGLARARWSFISPFAPYDYVQQGVKPGAKSRRKVLLAALARPHGATDATRQPLSCMACTTRSPAGWSAARLQAQAQ